MGMFDSVYVKCKNCGEFVEFQSKAGDCNLDEYDISNCPPKIAGDIAGETQLCRNCGSPNRIRMHTLLLVE